MPTSDSHLGWRNRGYLPHFDQPGLVQAVTFRLADSLPKTRLEEWDHLRNSSEDLERIRLIEDYLDQGAGECVLRRPECGQVVHKALQHFDLQRYRLVAWCVMPNHVHVLFEVWKGQPLGKVVHSWKTYSAREINTRLNRAGPLWQADYFDTYMRDADHLDATAGYIEHNPVKAGLVSRVEDWPWSSAAARGGSACMV